MPVPRRRHSKSRRDKARTHKLLKPVALVPCEKCETPRPRHRVCEVCGTYKGRQYKVVVTS